MPALTSGSYEPIAAEKDLLIYRRCKADSSVIVVLNFGGDPISLVSDSIVGSLREILLSIFMDRTGETIAGSLDLRGNEGVVASSP